MKATLVAMGALFALSYQVGVAQAASLEVEWVEPQKYTDVRPSNESRKRFRERTFTQLEEHMSELAAELPETYKLSMTVTDLDLAGQVFPSNFVGLGNGAAGDIRVIKDVFIPRMAFDYQLVDENGTVIASGTEVKLRDMNFRNGLVRRFEHEPYVYEKQMIEDWFMDELMPNLAQR